MVTEKDWMSFKENYIRKVFKDGYSVISATGHWYDTAAHRMITEATYMVICNYKKSAATSKQIDSLCYWYKTLFQQQSVMRVDKRARTYFE